MEFKDRILELRKSLKLSQEAFGVLCGGISKAAVSRWENGSNMPDVASLIALHKNTSASIDWLLFGLKPYADPDHNDMVEGIKQNLGKMKASDLEAIAKLCEHLCSKRTAVLEIVKRSKKLQNVS